MKDVIRILFFKNVGNYLDGEENNYIIKKLVTNDKNFNINDLCYDFDELYIYNQKRYEKFYIELKKVDNNIYSIKNKTYSIKRNLFT